MAGGSCWSPCREGELLLQRPCPEDSSPSLPGLLLASFLGLTWLWGLRLYSYTVRKYCFFFFHWGENTTFTKWCVVLFQIFLYLFISLHGNTSSAFMYCCSHITDGKIKHKALWGLARAYRRGLASQPLFWLKSLARLPWGEDSYVT